MIFKFCKRLCCFVLILMLISCGVHQKFELQQKGKLGEMSRDDFMNAMRWKQFDVAGSLKSPEHRKLFMKTFVPLTKDIHIIDVRLAYLQSSEENKRFEMAIEMDYYLLPSVTIKTFSFDQTWLYFDGEDSTPKGFFVTTPFPDFP